MANSGPLFASFMNLGRTRGGMDTSFTVSSVCCYILLCMFTCHLCALAQPSSLFLGKVAQGVDISEIFDLPSNFSADENDITEPETEKTVDDNSKDFNFLINRIREVTGAEVGAPLAAESSTRTLPYGFGNGMTGNPIQAAFNYGLERGPNGQLVPGSSPISNGRPALPPLPGQPPPSSQSSSPFYPEYASNPRYPWYMGPSNY